MLSVATLKSVSQASKYYEQGDYYAKEKQQNNSCWFGVGAKKLNLEGAVDPGVFNKLLKGELLDGTIMHKGYNAGGEETRRPGYDLTFSAAKSVSILAFKDPRIVDAHNKAVITTLQRIEQLASARVKIKGIVTNQVTKNLVVATFLHNVSRSLDPDLHTHCVIINMTEIKDKYRSLYGDNFYNLKKSLGLEYRLELAQNLMQLGYELEQTSKEGFFEIKGVPQAVIKQLSKRRQEIEQVLQEQGLDSQQKITMVLHKGTSYERTVNTVASSMANFITRSRKKFVNIKELQESWDQEIIRTGSSIEGLENLINKSCEQGPLKVIDKEKQIIEALPLAIKHLSEQKAIFSRKELLFTVKAFCITAIPNDAFVEKIIINQINEKELISLEGNRFTTDSTIKLEKNNILIMQQQKATCSACLPIGSKFVAKLLLNEPIQRSALHMLLSSKDRFLAIDAHLELDQQKVLKAFSLVALNAKSYIIAPKHEQANKFASEIGVNLAFSLNGFLYYVKKLALLNTSIYYHIWVFQKSHMLSSKDVASIQEYAIKLNTKVIFLGDHMCQGGINAGAPYRALLDHGIEHVNLSKNNFDNLLLLREQKVQQAIFQMEKAGDLVEIVDHVNRIKKAVEFAISNNAILITQNNTDKQFANRTIRKKMQEKGILNGSVIKVPVLIPVYLSNTQKQSLASYQIGDVIRFNKGIQNTIYTQGTYFIISEINHSINELLLEQNGHSCSLNFTSQVYNKLSLYRAEARELQVGERLIWNDSTPRKLQANSDFTKYQAKIINISSHQQIELVLENNKTFSIDLAEHKNRHIEYAYAQTLNKAVYQEPTNGVLLLNSNFQTISLTEIYTVLSSIKGTKKIYCNNIEMLKQFITEESGLQEHAHLQQQVALDRTVQNSIFAKIKGELDGNLLNYSTMLSAIVPEINLLNKNENKKLSELNPAEYLQAIDAVNFAVLNLTERQAIFSAEELISTAKQYDIKIADNLIKTAIDQAISEGLVINKGENSLLTKEIYAMECACLKIQKQGEDVLESMIISPNSMLDAIRDHKYFTESQKQAVLLIATSNDRVNLIQGIAGSGKTSMLKEVKKLAIEAGFQLLGIANTASAKNNVQTKTTELINDMGDLLNTGIPAKTLAKFLGETTKMLASNAKFIKQMYHANTIFILDEASLVSVRDMFSFLYLVEKLDARTIIIGDHKQLPSIGASHPFRLLLGRSNSKVIMDTNTRLQTKEALRLIRDIYAARIDDAFDKLLNVNNLIEIPNREERLQQMADYYLAASKEDRKEIMPMLPLNVDRVYFNQLVREGLKKEGTLTGMAIKHRVLVTKDLTFPETNHYLRFNENDLVKFNYPIKRLGINKGDLLLVVDRKDNQVLLLDQNYNKVSWDPVKFAAYFRGAIEVYTAAIREVMAGDLLRWNKNDEERGIINSETAEVITIKEGLVEVKLSSGKLLYLDLSQEINQHWDHAYGSTVYVVQGLDRYNPIGQGLGPNPSIRNVDQVKIADQIIIPGDANKNTISKVGKVVDIIKGIEKIEIVAIDRLNIEHRFFPDKVEVYPDFTTVEPPKMSSLENFLVMATRGDKFIMFVDNIESYKIAITRNQNLKQTALAVMLPEVGIEIQSKVNEMTNQVYGLADPEVINQSIKNSTKNTAKEKNDKILVSSKKIILNFTERKKQLIKPNYDLNQIKQELAKDILSHVSAWRGEPNQKTQREARWGKKGSFSVVLSGPKKGTWADFETGAAGRDLVSLYIHIFNLNKGSFSEVLQELAKQTGLDIIDRINNHTISKAKDPKLEQERERYINKVEKLYRSTAPIKGTLGHKYCYQYRGIKTKLPDNFRFKARCWHEELKTYRSALIVPGYDPNGKLQSVNRIYLNDDGSKLKESFKDQKGDLQPAAAKRNYGPTGGATIKINYNPKSDITMITEGMENALSIKQVRNDVNIISSFGVGQLKNLTIDPGTKTIILCADNDGIATNTKVAVLDALQKWQDQGYQVKLALPLDQDVTKKIDFNDLLIKHGEKAVDQSLSKAIHIDDLSNFSNKSSSLAQDFIKVQSKQQINFTENFSKDLVVVRKEQKGLNELSL